MNTIYTLLIILMDTGLSSPLASFGRFMYVLAYIALLIAGLSFIVAYWFKYRRYYKKGLLSLNTALAILFAGLFLFALGLLMVFY